jgi:hypothetical protein
MPDNIRFSNPDTMQKPPGYSHVVEVTGPGRTVYFASDEPATGRSSPGAALADASSSVSMATATAAARQAPPANVKNRGMTQPDWVW